MYPVGWTAQNTTNFYPFTHIFTTVFSHVGETGEEWATGRSEQLPFITKIAQWDSYTTGHMTPLVESVNLGHNLLGANVLSKA